MLLLSLSSKPTWAGEGECCGGGSGTTTRAVAGVARTASRNNNSNSSYALQYGKSNYSLYISKVMNNKIMNNKVIT
jgi:hypothetical protein